MEKKKVVVFFTNDRGKYYLEAIETFESFREDNWNVTKTIDETEDWQNYKLTKEELANPTTVNNECLMVIHYLDEHVDGEDVD